MGVGKFRKFRLAEAMSSSEAPPEDVLAARLAEVAEAQRKLRVRQRWIIVQRGMVMMGARQRIKVRANLLWSRANLLWSRLRAAAPVRARARCVPHFAPGGASLVARALAVG